MQVFPDTVLRIHKGCPCDPDYEHTINIGNKEGQHAYFTTITKYRLNDMSYQRPTNGRIRVPYNVNDLYDCNYISFQNTAFGNKWFYAFIDSVEYVNNTTSEINYTIDVLQTWMYDIDLTQCFVAREHSVTDVAGDNLVAETVSTGEMQAMYNYKNVGDIDQSAPQIVVVTAGTSVGQTYKGVFYGSILNCARYLVYPATSSGADGVKSLLDELDVWNNPQAILAIFMCPTKLLMGGADDSQFGTVAGGYKIQGRQMLYRSDGNKVKNNKLLTYPYTYLYATNLCGTNKIYAYEYFKEVDDGELGFEYATSYTDTLSFTLSPRGYKTPLSAVNYDESITYNRFPNCAYAISDFNNRVTNGLISGSLGAVAGAISGSALGVGGAIAGGVLGALSSGMSGFSGKGITVNDGGMGVYQGGNRVAGQGKRVMGGSEYDDLVMSAATTQLKAAGNMINSGVSLSTSANSNSGFDLFNNGKFGVYYTQMQPAQEFIDRIDDYFSRYGYATNKIKVPNIDSRPHWNYIQTVGCKVNASIPCNDERLICAIFDKGVTFWKNPAEVGNFSLDNSPT